MEARERRRKSVNQAPIFGTQNYVFRRPPPCRHSQRSRTLDPMPDEFAVTCPYCGETVEIYVEADVRGSFVQDCEVCCNPWRVRVVGGGDERDVEISRA